MPHSKDAKRNENSPFACSYEDQMASNKLRRCLIYPPILACPNFENEFYLFTDACNCGVGAVFSQKQKGKEVFIAFAMKQLKPREIKYATNEKETWAVVFAIKESW